MALPESCHNIRVDLRLVGRVDKDDVEDSRIRCKAMQSTDGISIKDRGLVFGPKSLEVQSDYRTSAARSFNKRRMTRAPTQCFDADSSGAGAQI